LPAVISLSLLYTTISVPKKVFAFKKMVSPIILKFVLVLKLESFFFLKKKKKKKKKKKNSHIGRNKVIMCNVIPTA